MPSVEVDWRGRCRDRRMQEDLTAHLRSLADAAAPLFEDRWGAGGPVVFIPDEIDAVATALSFDPASLSLDQKLELAGAHPELMPSEPAVTIHDHALGGLVSVSPYAFGMAPGTFDPEADPPVFPGELISVYGIEFRLHDARDLRNPDRYSFVFTRSAEESLDGHLVEVYPPALCQRMGALFPEAPPVDWCLAAPSIVLRYYLEAWTNHLLAWVRHFFVPGLWYWNNADLPEARRYEAIDPCDAAGRAASFDELKAAFLEEHDRVHTGRDAAERRRFPVQGS